MILRHDLCHRRIDFGKWELILAGQENADGEKHGSDWQPRLMPDWDLVEDQLKMSHAGISRRLRVGHDNFVGGGVVDQIAHREMNIPKPSTLYQDRIGLADSSSKKIALPKN